MYFIEKGEDLVGKTIAFIHCAQFAEAITIATTDGGLMVIEQQSDGSESEITIYNAYAAEFHIFQKDRRKWMIEELQKLGITTKDDYEKHLEARRKEQEAREKRDREIHERFEHNEYLRLKAKFEGA